MSKRKEWIYNNWRWLRKDIRSYKKLCSEMPEAKQLLLKNEQFRNCAKRKRCFILGNGPSLRSVDFSKLQQEDVFTVNQAARHPNFHLLSPRFHFWADPAFFEINPDNPGDMELLRTMKSINSTDHRPACFFPIRQKSFVENSHSAIHPLFRRAPDFTTVVPGGYTVVIWCIMMALFAGYREIYLLGCDNTSIMVNLKSLLKQNDDSDYAYAVTANEKGRLENMVLRQGIRAQAEAFLQTLKEYEWMLEYCRYFGATLVNCSSTTVIDCIPRKKLEDVLSDV